MKFWIVLTTCFFISHSFAAPLSKEDKEIFAKLKQKLSGQGDLIRRTIKRVGDKTIELEAYISTELSLKDSKPILANFVGYKNWALRNINKNPEGGTYRLKFLALEPVTKNVLNLKYKLDVPLFSKPGDQRFEMGLAETPNYLRLSAKAIPKKDSMIDWAIGVAKAFPSPEDPNRVWAHVSGRIRVHPWLLYEALPDRLLDRMVANRIKIFLDTLLEEQDKRLMPSLGAAKPFSASTTAKP